MNNKRLVRSVLGVGGFLLAGSMLLGGCDVDSQDSEGDSDQELGEATDAFCSLSSGSRPSPVFTRSLDSASSVSATDTPSSSDCDLVAMEVDTDPNRAENVAVYFYTLGSCDAVTHQAAVWKRTGSGPYYSWSLSSIPITLFESGIGILTSCEGAGLLDLGTNSFTQVVVAAHAERAGTPIETTVIASR